MHGVSLFSSACATKGQHAANLMLPGDKDSPPVSFKLDQNAMARLKPFFRTTGGQAIACGVFSGQVFYKKGFRLKRFGGDSIGNGFGENGRLRAAFVLRSIEEIHACS